MRRKTTFLLSLLLTIALGVSAQTSEPRHEILLETDSGNVRIALYNETPQHRDNILRLVEAHAYDGVLFHRVISNFMVQTGDLGSIGASQGKLLGDTPEKYSVPAEIRFPQLFHKRGAVAAAREGDDVNPERRSSATQFYIVWGRQWDDASLDKLQQRIDQMTQGTVKLTPEIREVYKTLGGTPHLDGSYTVFGEVVEGLEVVERIEKAATDDHDRPLKDIRVVRATVVK
ncbi:MAG TPA: peptidylprolyl isomerase [Prevotella sp.]|nr:peptidylprolyl isomerase [Prevotella sp.]